MLIAYYHWEYVNFNTSDKLAAFDYHEYFTVGFYIYSSSILLS